MTGKQIKELIDLKNSRLKLAIAADTFSLNADAAKLIEDIALLRRKCPHEFKDGKCIYCYSTSN